MARRAGHEQLKTRPKPASSRSYRPQIPNCGSPQTSTSAPSSMRRPAKTPRPPRREAPRRNDRRAPKELTCPPWHPCGGPFKRSAALNRRRAGRPCASPGAGRRPAVAPPGCGRWDPSPHRNSSKMDPKRSRILMFLVETRLFLPVLSCHACHPLLVGLVRTALLLNLSSKALTNPRTMKSERQNRTSGRAYLASPALFYLEILAFFL